MGEVGFLYKSSIAIACVILMLASIACTGWFFYTWLGGTPGIVGASVGCAVQLMAYGFSGVIVNHAKGLLRTVLILLIASALSLSVLSSYATLTGYFTALQNEKHARETTAAQKDKAVQAALAQRMQLMESMSRDVELGSEAANQGLSDKYRTQAKQFLTNNSATRNEMAEQIEKLEALAQSDLMAQQVVPEASPIDGLSSVLGGQNTAIMILCIWLAIMFDALPIAGITLLEAKKKGLHKAEPEKADTSKEAEAKIEPKTESEPLALSAIPDDTSPSNLIELETGPEGNLRILTNLCSVDLQASKAFFVELLNLEVKYESDWYIQLSSPYDPEIEFGLIHRDNELVPLRYQNTPNGMYLTFVVEDVDSTYEIARELGIDILQEPRNEFYGQRRFLAREPSGCLIDISSPWEAEEIEEEVAEEQQSVG